ncbi:MAG: hypothetical protein E6G92_12425 [Alphaproteobacteria bacterium]|nr:MAG: hypothetical protein E6G92_12425 [Alphaproteobacteria bacterium]
MFTQNSRSALKIALMAISLIVESSTAAQTDNGDTFSLRAPETLPNSIQLYATAYIVQGAEESVHSGDPWLLGRGGASLGLRIPRRIWCLAAVEGSLTVNVRAGGQRGYAYAGRGPTRVADCSDVFRSMNPDLRSAVEHSVFAPTPADAPYGLGARSSYRLVPYRSIAIDLAAAAPLRLGQVIFIPRLRGARITMPDGRIASHDGYVMAVDTGGAIKGRHIDFFEGPRPTDVLISELRTPFEAYVVENPQAAALLTRLHARTP